MITIALALLVCCGWLYLQDVKVQKYIKQSEENSLSELLPDFDTTKPIHVPDEWVTWEGKDRGMPRSPILWL